MCSQQSIAVADNVRFDFRCKFTVKVLQLINEHILGFTDLFLSLQTWLCCLCVTLCIRSANLNVNFFVFPLCFQNFKDVPTL